MADMSELFNIDKRVQKRDKGAKQYYELWGEDKPWADRN